MRVNSERMKSDLNSNTFNSLMEIAINVEKVVSGTAIKTKYKIFCKVAAFKFACVPGQQCVLHLLFPGR